MFLNVRKLEKDHNRFLKSHLRAVDAAMADSKKSAENFVEHKPGFTHRTRKTLEKTQTKVIRRRNGRVVVLRVANNTKVARFLEKGTKAHPIKAKRRKSLRWWGFGRVIYRKAVQHPGTKPYRFLSRARNRAYLDFEKHMRPRMNRIASNF